MLLPLKGVGLIPHYAKFAALDLALMGFMSTRFMSQYQNLGQKKYVAPVSQRSPHHDEKLRLLKFKPMINVLNLFTTILFI